jgi:hypothetical protein
MFRLLSSEWQLIRSQIVTNKEKLSLRSQIVILEGKGRQANIYHMPLPNRELPC